MTRLLVLALVGMKPKPALETEDLARKGFFGKKKYV
jgi:hypothetical protein